MTVYVIEERISGKSQEIRSLCGFYEWEMEGLVIRRCNDDDRISYVVSALATMQQSADTYTGERGLHIRSLQ